MHSTKSIRIKRTRAELPLPRCRRRPAGSVGASVVPPPPARARPLLSSLAPSQAAGALMTPESAARPGYRYRWLPPSLPRDGPPDARFSWEDLEEQKRGSCKVLLGILNRPPLAPTLTLPFILERASFRLWTDSLKSIDSAPAPRTQDPGSRIWAQTPEIGLPAPEEEEEETARAPRGPSPAQPRPGTVPREAARLPTVKSSSHESRVRA